MTQLDSLRMIANTMNSDMTPGASLTWMIQGFQVSQMIYSVVQFKIADLLSGGPKRCDELAAEAGLHAPSLYRLLRALAGVNIFHEHDDKRFELTSTGNLLRADVPGSLRASVISNCELWWREYVHLPHSIKTGEVAFDHVHGLSLFDYLEQAPEEAATFNATMVALTGSEIQSIVTAYDFSQSQVLVDVGGGHGALMRGILATDPGSRGILFDQPSVIAKAGAPIEAAGLTDRCELVGGSFFDSIPSGGDTYTFKRIIHDWNDELSTVILQNCRKGIAETGKVLLIETVIPPRNEPSLGKIEDVSMMLVTGGMERTEAEYQILLASAGFRLTEIFPTTSGLSIIEAVPI